MNRTTRRIALVAFVVTLTCIALDSKPSRAAIESRDTLETYFETGDVPTADQFGDVIDSYIHQSDDGIVLESLNVPGGLGGRLGPGATVGAGSAFGPVDVARPIGRGIPVFSDCRSS